MITESLLRELLSRFEHRPIDFKAEPHRLGDEHSNSEFIKDILAMANTTRDESAYIIIGVKLHDDGSREYLGVREHPDDADLQDKLKLARVEPKPSFVYQPVVLDGKSYGVIEIPLVKDGPYFGTKDYGVVKANRLYFRRGTKNDEASIQEQGGIYQWFHDEAVRPANSTRPERAIREWDRFYLACHKFDPDRLFALVLGPNNQAGASWGLIGRLPLSLVLDFDSGTEQDGVYSRANAILRGNRSIHLLTRDDQYTLVPEKACYWYAARGLQGRVKSLVGDDWKEWNRKYSNDLRALTENLARTSGGRPITVISLWYAPEYVREVCTAMDRAFGESADFVFAIPDSGRLQDVAAQFSGQLLSMSPEDIHDGIDQHIAAPTSNPIYAGVPHFDGAFRLIELPELRWLSEDFELLHSNVELDTLDDGKTLGIDFLKGAVIGWPDLSSHFDADRDATEQILKQVESELEARASVRLNLYHWPGAGGTTVARRVAWQLRRQYPAVLLKRTTIGETVSRFRRLFEITSQPILAVVEGADAKSDTLEQLYTEVKAEQIPIVFLSVLRRYQNPRGGERVTFLGQSLSIPESLRFAEAYKRAAPNKSSDLKRILDASSDRERTPFQFALTAFGRQYTGLSRYVQARLETANPNQKQIITFLALAYFYGHKTVLPQIFAAHLGYLESRRVRFEEIFSDLQLELLVKEEDGKWRPAHQLIAEDILQMALSGGASDRRNWKRGLSDWSLEFIRACCKSTIIANEDLTDLVRRIFILRDEHDLLGTEGAGLSQFALLMEHVPTLEGRLSILKELVDQFPHESHFWGHLGRFYSIAMDEPDKALEALTRAIELSPEDPVLHHMQGMCYRRIAYQKMKEAEKDVEKGIELAVRETVQKAIEAFGHARSLDPGSDHAHISPAQLLLRSLDFGYKLSHQGTRAEFLVSPSASWYREKLDEVEELLDHARNLREGQKVSTYLLDCEARLEEVYDNYSRALEGWNQLLTRHDVYAPPIRREIVHAYLSRQKRNWSFLDSKEIERIVDLMEDNMREEPTSDRNIQLWFRAVRFSSRQDIDVALDKLANWKSLGDSIEAHYYLYVLHVLKAIDGSMIERARSEELIKASRARARDQRNRTRSFEWFGRGEGLRRLKHSSELGNWSEPTNFYSNTGILERVEGTIAEIRAPETGTIELSTCGLPVFFVPAVPGFFRGRDENLRVTFYLGFSYDGLRAWSVKPI